ncbi:N-6 DNA methylase [Congregibacter litoralis]|uniref:DNA methylase adenine-specific domain-containing protein n=1 Tax=Congregibacter litoralis KT71 TaxID=314285 RepID=A4ACW2_9GAMM|nr:N-6 DNA methylase [Congregibacter litoralis]EAQ96153.1 hypothetical protein KT71_18846 [Congregibacter litoralis KT71]
MGNLCYRQAKNEEDRLGQFSTPPAIANLLAGLVANGINEPVSLLDLGAGGGPLAKALDRCIDLGSSALLEVDCAYTEQLACLPIQGEVKVVRSDFLGDEWLPTQSPNVVLSNPPYGSFKASQRLQKLSRDLGFQTPVKGEWMRTDAAFLVRAWSFMELGTRIGFIVSEAMITHPSFAKFRSVLVNKLSSLEVIKLEPTIFARAEVSAYMIVGTRAVSRRRNVVLQRADSAGQVTEELHVSHSDAVLSLDLDYHAALKRLSLSVSETSSRLYDLNVSINRGSRSRKQFLDLGISAFHTTDFPEHSDEVVLGTNNSSGYRDAKSGDILIPRVGTRCLDKQARVSAGAGVFTDCVYRISAEASIQKVVWKTLSSAFGSEWRMAVASGSCAKHLPLATLRSMPLLF